MFEKLLKNMDEETKDLNFSETIRAARSKMGMMQYRVAKRINMGNQRLKNLETGYFRKMPKIEEIWALADMFNLNTETLIKKAKKHIREREKQKKIYTIKSGE